MALPATPQVKAEPLLPASMLCSQLRALEQAAVSAQHCEGICKDMVATACCRAGLLCDLVAFGSMSGHADSICTALRLAKKTVEAATDELYRYILSTSTERPQMNTYVREFICEQRRILQHRFNDISGYLQYFDLRRVREVDHHKEHRYPLTYPDSVVSLRRELLSLQNIRTCEQVMSLARSSLARKSEQGQHACGNFPQLQSIAMSPDEQEFVTYGLKGHAALWDTTTGLFLREFIGHAGRVCDVAFSKDGSILATCSEDTTVRLWVVSTGASMHVLEGHSSRVNSVSWSPDMSMLVSCSQDSSAKVWDVQNGSVVHNLSKSESEVLGAVWCFGHENNLGITTWSVDGMLDCWYAYSQKPLSKSPSHQNPSLSIVVEEGVSVKSARVDLRFQVSGVATRPMSLQTHPHGERYSVVCSDHNVRLSETFLPDTSVTKNQTSALKCHTAQINAVAWNPDGMLLATCSADFTVRLHGCGAPPFWTAWVSYHVLEGHTGSVTCAAWSPDSCKLVTGSVDGTARLWNVTTGALERVLQEQPGAVTSAAFSGRDVFIASDDGALRIHRVMLGMY